MSSPSVGLSPPPVTALIGGTPVMDVSTLLSERAHGVRLFAKLEGQSIAGSVKDRPALYMIEDALDRRALREGMGILEASSGNTAIALSMLGVVYGIPVTIVAPDNITRERRQLLSFFGATVIESPAVAGTRRSREMAASMSANRPDLCWLDQYANPANPLAHYETTGPEILRAIGPVDVLVAGIGSGGTIMGTGRRLREANPDTKLVGVEPHPGSKVDGLRNLAEDSFIPPNLDPDTLDGKILATSADAFRMVRAAARLGLFLGMSAGAVLSGAVRYAERIGTGTMCAVLADGGWKYLSVGIAADPAALGEAVDSMLEISW